MSYEVVRLEDVCDVRDGTHDSPKYVVDGFPLVTSKNITDGKLNLENVNLISKEDYDSINKRSRVNIGDIIMPMIGTIGNPHLIVEKPMFAIKNVALFKPKENLINNRYLYKILLSSTFKAQLDSESRGGTQKFVSLKVLRNLQIPLPPLDIQKKIADTLDKAQELIDKRKEQISALDKFLENLFLDMFGDPVSNPMGWETGKLEKVAPIKASDKKFSNDEYIWNLTLDQIISNSNVVLKKEYKKFEEVSTSTFIFDKTQVLYSKLRPYLNKVLVPDENGVATSELVALNPKILILNQFFLLYLLRNNSFLKFISDKVSGAKMPRVVMDEFKQFNIILPPLELQNQFASIVEKVEAEKAKLEDSLKEMEDNFNSIMQRAFKGELF